MSETSASRWPLSWRQGRIAAAGLLGLIVLGGLLFYMLKIYPAFRSAPYRQAMERLRQHTPAQRLLGSSIEAGWLVRGTVDRKSGRARLTIPVSGSQNEGTLHVAAEQAEGAWTFSRLELVVEDNSSRLSLLNERRPPRSEEAPLRVPPRYRE